MLVDQLVEFGLSEKEARVYLALLELEVASVNEIAQKTDIRRSSVYNALEPLKERGLVHTSQESHDKQRFVVAPPERLLEIAQAKKRKSISLQASIFEVLSDLRALYKDTYYKPEIEVFEGKEGVIQAFNKSLDDNIEKYMRVYSSAKNMYEYFPEYIFDYVQRRFDLGIRMKGIHPDDRDIWPKLIENSPPGLDEFAVIPTEKYKFASEVAIHDNKVNLTSFKEEMAIIITGDEIANTMKALFDLAWPEAQRIKVNK